ncbi:MAG: 4-(cytidine 5'-diphospho)-2-C-methyl-D-erythritol kinase [Bryobacteraceae bacterium]
MAVLATTTARSTIGSPIRVRVPSFAKLNLDLRVGDKRADGYHELRTVFQTISLKDDLAIEFERARKTEILLDSSVDIPDNLVVLATKAVLDHLRLSARVRLVLDKRIPMGAGLGGGSSNAAAVLMALPALAGKPISAAELGRLAAQLGSDVPYFLCGGTAVGLGRGTELYPLPDLPSLPVLVVASGVHVSTSEAYRALNRGARSEPESATLPNVTNALTSLDESHMLREFQAVVWGLSASGLALIPLKNDFEQVVFQKHPELRQLVRKLRRLGAKPAQMTGSGSAVFGIFDTAGKAMAARSSFGGSEASAVAFLPRRRYKTLWRRALGAYFDRSCLA